MVVLIGGFKVSAGQVFKPEAASSPTKAGGIVCVLGSTELDCAAV